MSGLLQVWRAGRVRRWHTNPHLAGSEDYDDGHSARVALLALKLKPDLTRGALIYALSHDLGEYAVGDISWDAKQVLPNAAMAALTLAEMQGREALGLPEGPYELSEARLIKLCDWLDAWTWMRHHAPHLSKRADWAEQLEAVLDLADTLYVGRKVRRFVNEVREDT